ncbi:MAG: hypothetical protein OXP09_21525 [Gammaproteobacteria bacterium]|nr:hypothetical protein [Rhodospirillaceae bacterium]MDE0368137.1 hypothetical protein [Gammaproteobacteria bacterium]
MANALLNFGAAGAVVLVLWLLMRAEFRSVNGRLDRLEKSVDDLTKEHNSLAREFSDLRATMRVWMGAVESGRIFPFERKPKDSDRVS